MELKQGHYYSNGAYGRNWGVRMVMAIAPDPDSGEDVVSFKGVAGSSRRQHGSMAAKEFLRWVRYEVRLVENDWKRVVEDLPPPNLPRQAGEEQTSRRPVSSPPSNLPRQAGDEQRQEPSPDIPSPLAGEG